MDQPESPELDDVSSPDPVDAETLPPIDDDEILQLEKVFSFMIDQTCESGPSAPENIFEHTFIPKDWYSFMFRSIVPSHETVQQHLEHELPRQLFQYQDGEGVKYAFKVLDRRTNQLTYEQMPRYQKYSMRLLFSGPVQREILHTRAIKSFFDRETRRLGRAFDDPKSRKHIPSFVKMYQINLNELLLPDLSDYATFNEFFYRKLKPNARPIANRDDTNTIVSAADCRLILFNNITDATRIWVKGRHFSLKNLFDDEQMAQEFRRGSIAIFRLAPVDYHRFHSPISGKLGPQVKQIAGTYYTVNPIAIREKLNVLTKNQRSVITIENPQLEKVAFVAIGALLVGSVNFTVQPQQNVVKGDELGYFAYGGSTIVAVFKAGMVKWDDDLLHNSDNAMETLVQMGTQIGQINNAEQRQEMMSATTNKSQKNSTISQLFSHIIGKDGVI